MDHFSVQAYLKLMRKWIRSRQGGMVFSRLHHVEMVGSKLGIEHVLPWHGWFPEGLFSRKLENSEGLNDLADQNIAIFDESWPGSFQRGHFLLKLIENSRRKRCNDSGAHCFQWSCDISQSSSRRSQSPKQWMTETHRSLSGSWQKLIESQIGTQ